MNVTVHSSGSRLRVGDVIGPRSSPQIVVLVNECRARVVPLNKKHISYETLGGKHVEFEAVDKGGNISPNSDVEILERRGEAGAKEYQ